MRCRGLWLGQICPGGPVKLLWQHAGVVQLTVAQYTQKSCDPRALQEQRPNPSLVRFVQLNTRQHAYMQSRAGRPVLKKYGNGEQADLDEGGALRGLGAVVHDGAPLHGHQLLNATVRRHAPAPPPLDDTQSHHRSKG